MKKFLEIIKNYYKEIILFLLFIICISIFRIAFWGIKVNGDVYVNGNVSADIDSRYPLNVKIRNY